MVFKPKMIAGLAVSALVLTGCVTSNPNPNGARDGAIVGGILGGFLGAANSDNALAGAALGGAAGALAGAAIGDLLTRQAEDLRSSLANDNIQIVNTGNELIVTMPEGILFDVDSAAIRASLQSDLQALARNLQRYPETTVDVIGHTDNTGSAAYNQDLSARRAQAVGGVLLQQGVAPSRVRSFGRGEDQPVASNLTAEGRQQNRRVEVIIRPIQ